MGAAPLPPASLGMLPSAPSVAVGDGAGEALQAVGCALGGLLVLSAIIAAGISRESFLAAGAGKQRGVSLGIVWEVCFCLKEYYGTTMWWGWCMRVGWLVRGLWDGGREKRRCRGNLGSLGVSALLCSSAVLQRGGKALGSPISQDGMKP